MPGIEFACPSNAIDLANKPKQNWLSAKYARKSFAPRNAIEFDSVEWALGCQLKGECTFRTSGLRSSYRFTQKNYNALLFKALAHRSPHRTHDDDHHKKRSIIGSSILDSGHTRQTNHPPIDSCVCLSSFRRGFQPTILNSPFLRIMKWVCDQPSEPTQMFMHIKGDSLERPRIRRPELLRGSHFPRSGLIRRPPFLS